MALPVARRTVMCNISFDGLLDKSNEAALFIELIKYILFEKNQMPEMFDQLKRSTRVRGKNANPKISNKNERQAFLLFSSCQKLFADITSAFQNLYDIKESIIVLGSSPTNPKEIYHIQFPTTVTSGLKPLSCKESKQSLFLQIFAQDPFHVGQKIALTNLHVLLLLPRCTKIQGFTAKPTYKVPGRSQHYYLKLTCKAKEDPEVSLVSQPKVTDIVLDISGIVPLDIDDENEEKCSQPIANDKEFFKLVEEETEDDYIWFQANVNIKGYQLG
ncbi:unnamed protein product [Acanthosepion pharaonis]|uniref:MAD2L1-binding protein n=1 Tax=Acanthosepion pharaonis TaxID=158019 RepID=A0A812CQM7_ACAPH|nr:unnamed protein product [Sepia pharaonis]